MASSRPSSLVRCDEGHEAVKNLPRERSTVRRLRGGRTEGCRCRKSKHIDQIKPGISALRELNAEFDFELAIEIA
jgi:hypothetical protein